MIEINLLPGAKRGKKASAGPAINFAAIAASISERVKDKFLAIAVGAGVLSFGVIGALYTVQGKKASDLAEREKKAVADSSRFAVVLADRSRAEARRDSAMLQLRIIRAIDDERFIWPHILDEISRALPQYTWLRTVNWAGTAQGLNPPAAFKVPADTGKKKKAAVFPQDTVHVRLIGQTADVQALTRFYRNLEDSPFLGAVQLVKSEVQLVGGKEVTQFTFDFEYTRPDSTMIRRAPLTTTQK